MLVTIECCSKSFWDGWIWVKVTTATDLNYTVEFLKEIRQKACAQAGVERLRWSSLVMRPSLRQFPGPLVCCPPPPISRTLGCFLVLRRSNQIPILSLCENTALVECHHLYYLALTFQCNDFGKQFEAEPSLVPQNLIRLPMLPKVLMVPNIR